MKTSLLIPDAVYGAVKRRAAASGRTIGDIVEQGLREWLAREQAKPDAYSFHPPIIRGSRAPNVSVDDRDMLHDFMEKQP